MKRAKIDYVKMDNCFTHIENFAKAQRLLNTQVDQDWPTVLEKLAARSNPLHGKLLPGVRSSLANLRRVARSPVKLALLFGGSALVTLAYIAGLWASVEAFGGSGDRSPDVNQGGRDELARSDVRVASPSWIARVFFGADYSTRAESTSRPRGPAGARRARRRHRMGWRLSDAAGLTAGTCACS